MNPISIARPSIDHNEIDAVVEVMKTGELAQGKWVYEFEDKFSQTFDLPYSAAVCNGTVALHVALQVAGVQPDDLVLTTPFTFVATSNAILYCGAIPIYVDIDEHTYNISIDSLKEMIAKYPQARYLMLVHLFGQSCNMDEIIKLTKENNITIIEDCAQSHGATYDSKPVGSFGIAGTFSFYPTKNMSTGEGGLITSTQPSVIEDCKLLINHGSNTRYVHEVLGYNYRMTNIAAAIGIEQLKKIDNMNQRRLENATQYLENIDNKLIKLPFTINKAKHVFHQFTIQTTQRDHLAEYLTKNNIGSGIYYPYPLHQQKHIVHYLNDKNINIPKLPVTELVAQKVISIPVHPLLEENEVEYIIETLNAYSV